MDTGCFRSVPPLQAAGVLQLDSLVEESDFWHEVTPTDKKFGFANGLSHQCVFRWIKSSLSDFLAGGSITFQSLDQPGTLNSTPAVNCLALSSWCSSCFSELFHATPSKSTSTSTTIEHGADHSSSYKLCSGTMEFHHGRT